MKIAKEGGIEIVIPIIPPFTAIYHGIGVIVKGNLQAPGQSDTELVLYCAVGQQQRVESLGFETQQGKLGQCPGINAGAAVCQQGGLAEVTPRPNMTDNKPPFVFHIHGQFRFPRNDYIESAVIFASPVDIATLLDDSPAGGIDNLSNQFGIDVLKKGGIADTLS
jgi:hypothetical protein